MNLKLTASLSHILKYALVGTSCCLASVGLSEIAKSKKAAPDQSAKNSKKSLDIVQLAPKINSHKQLSVNFVQTRETAVTRKRKLPTGQMNQRGVAFFQRDPNRFLWKVTEPAQSRKTISFNGSRLSIFFPDINLEKTYSTAGSVGQEYQKIILMLQDPIEFLKEYDMQSSKRLSPGVVAFNFKNNNPLSETQSVAINIDEKQNIISKAELTYKGNGSGESESGERTLRFEFSNPVFTFSEDKLDPQIPPTAKTQAWD